MVLEPSIVFFDIYTDDKLSLMSIISPLLITIDLFTGVLNSLNSFNPTHFVFLIIKSTSIRLKYFN